MKKPRSLVILLTALLVALAIAAADIVVVKIQATQLRKNPQFFAPAVVALKAGDKLEKVSEANGWVQVKTSAGLVGWVHSSAIETPKFALTAANKDMKTQATATEVALAAKGFNKQVEDSYRAKHSEANFAAVDAMFLVKVSLAQIADFLKKGRLGDFQGVK
ncbi:MAG: SH3 domain-containing protein [Candidatus Aminicenantes bacterium]|nr:SH3 domain-containing protein [Candidatus Aminicenantes bacterium]